MKKQEIFWTDNGYEEFGAYLLAIKARKVLLVCGNSMNHLSLDKYLRIFAQHTGIEFIRFSDFHPNPVYESVVKGIDLFKRQNCDTILAVGGGSAIDVAKCIRCYAEKSMVCLVVAPTTAGTGSEATKFAVIYDHGEKQTVTDDRCMPEAVLFDPSALLMLPMYQRKSAMMDAFCHGIESFWSVNATNESKEYSKQSIQLILDNLESYLNNQESGNRNMLLAANLAGKAINIAQTTAGHAMCYKLTGLYGIAHGHAAALCVAKLWPYMLRHIELCVDDRESGYLMQTFEEIAQAMGCADSMEAVCRFQEILESLELCVPAASESDLAVLRVSANPIRMGNNPVMLTEDSIEKLYRHILVVGHEELAKYLCRS